MEIPRRGISAILKVARVPDSKVDKWKRELALSPRWRPSREVYARTKRIFKDFEEFLLVTCIQTNFLTKRLYYCDKDFKLDALQVHQERTAERGRGILLGDLILVHADPERFLCCRPFIRAFCERNQLSLRRPGFKTRAAVTEEEIRMFIELVDEFMNRCLGDRILNIDETNWKVVGAEFLT
jgi:hypothetical protein